MVRRRLESQPADLSLVGEIRVHERDPDDLVGSVTGHAKAGLIREHDQALLIDEHDPVGSLLEHDPEQVIAIACLVRERTMQVRDERDNGPWAGYPRVVRASERGGTAPRCWSSGALDHVSTAHRVEMAA
jgi:hypothetical protein